MANIIDELVIRLGLDAKGMQSGEKQAAGALEAVEKQASKTSAAVGRAEANRRDETGKTGKQEEKQAKDSAIRADRETKRRQESEKTTRAESDKTRVAVMRNTLAMIGTGVMFAKSTTDTAIATANLSRQAQNLGVGADKLSAWGGAAAIAGGSAEGFGAALASITQAQTEMSVTGNTGMLPYLNMLGVSLADSKNKARPVIDVFQSIADGLKKVEAQQGRAQAVNIGKMMGYDEGTINLMLKSRQEIDALVGEQEKLNRVTKEQELAAVELSSAWEKAKLTFASAARDLMVALTPAIKGAYDATANFLGAAGPVDWNVWAGHVNAAVNKAGEALSWLSDKFNSGGNAIREFFNSSKSGQAQWDAIGEMTAKGLAWLGYKPAMEAVARAEGKGGSATAPSPAGPLAEAAAREEGRSKPATTSGPLAEAVAKGEGGYSSVNLGKAGGYRSSTRPLEQMTVAEVMQAQLSREFNAAGKYQSIRDTLRNVAKRMGLSGSEKFDAAMQDKMFEALLPEGVKAYREGRSNDKQGAMIALSKVWRSIADPRTGQTYGDAGASVNKARAGSLGDVGRALDMERAANMKRGSATSSQSITIGKIDIHTQATDANGIARDMNQQVMAQFNRGAV